MKQGLVGLRRCAEADVPLRYRWEAAPLVRDNVLPTAFETPRSKYIEMMVARLNRGDEAATAFIIQSRGGRPLGLVWLANIDWEERTAQFGVIIGEEGRRGIGFGPAAVEALVEHAFGDLNLHAIYNYVYDVNDDMRRLVKNVEPDFVVDADLNVGGRYVGAAMYTVINGKRGLRW